MDSIALIITALVAGAAKASGDIAPDAYNVLKALIQRKFSGKPKAEMILEEHSKDPETYEAPMKKELAEARADKDKEIITTAQKLLEQLDPQNSALGKYKIEFQGEVKGVQIGENNVQHNQFN